MTNEARRKKVLFTFVWQCVVIALVLELDLYSAYCQESTFFYYSDSCKIGLTVSRDLMAVRFKQGVTLEEQKTIV